MSIFYIIQIFIIIITIIILSIFQNKNLEILLATPATILIKQEHTKLCLLISFLFIS